MDLTEQITRVNKRIKQLEMEIGHGQYYDVQTDESFTGGDAIQRDHEEIMVSLPYINACSGM